MGLDDGTIDLVRCPSDKAFITFETVVTNKVHAARVMGVRTDPFLNCVLSIAEDCEFRVSEDEHLVKLYGMTFKNPLTELEYDLVNKRAFIASNKGEFMIYSLNDKKNPAVLLTLNTTSCGCVRGMTFDPISHYVFTGGHDDGEICTFFV